MCASFVTIFVFTKRMVNYKLNIAPRRFLLRLLLNERFSIGIDFLSRYVFLFFYQCNRKKLSNIVGTMKSGWVSIILEPMKIIYEL